jgi:hypothetical protein
VDLDSLRSWAQCYAAAQGEDEDITLDGIEGYEHGLDFDSPEDDTESEIGGDEDDYFDFDDWQ